MSYYLYLIETKKEYTQYLTNLLTPLIYEGISSIYETAKETSTDNHTILTLFQNLLRRIPSWNEYIIEQETNRIIKSSNKHTVLDDLIKAVIKANIMILTNTCPEDKDKIKIKHDITVNKFIHNVYIETARNIFQNPYLFYDKYTSFELKKNQREALDLIKKSINESIRKLLPLNPILQSYLGDSFNNIHTDDFNNPILDSEYNNIKLLLSKENIKINKINKKDDLDLKEVLKDSMTFSKLDGGNSIPVKLETNILSEQNLKPSFNDPIVESIIDKQTEAALSSKKTFVINNKKISESKHNINNTDNLIDSQKSVTHRIKVDLKSNYNDDLETSAAYYNNAEVVEVYDNKKLKSSEKDIRTSDKEKFKTSDKKSIDYNSISNNIDINFIKKDKNKYFNQPKI